MKICPISDLHGILPNNIQSCDVVVIAGDIVPLNIQRMALESSRWFIDVFIPWALNLPCDKVIFVAGNHDFWLNRWHWKEIQPESEKLIYLEDDAYVYNGLTFYGTPWITGLPGWAFYTENEEKYFDNIPENVDVLITHAPCFGNKTGEVLQKKVFNTGSDYGSKVLAEYVTNKRNVRYMFSGHIHSGEHQMKLWNNTYVKCCSIVDEHYDNVYPIEYIDI